MTDIAMPALMNMVQDTLQLRCVCSPCFLFLLVDNDGGEEKHIILPIKHSFLWLSALFFYSGKGRDPMRGILGPIQNALINTPGGEKKLTVTCLFPFFLILLFHMTGKAVQMS